MHVFRGSSFQSLLSGVTLNDSLKVLHGHDLNPLIGI